MYTALHQLVHALLLLTLGIALGLLGSLLIEIFRPRLYIGLDDELIFVVRLVYILHCLRVSSTCRGYG